MIRFGKGRWSLALASVATLLILPAVAMEPEAPIRAAGEWQGIRWEGSFYVGEGNRLFGRIHLPDQPELGDLDAAGELRGTQVKMGIFLGAKHLMDLEGHWSRRQFEADYRLNEKRPEDTPLLRSAPLAGRMATRFEVDPASLGKKPLEHPPAGLLPLPADAPIAGAGIPANMSGTHIEPAVGVDGAQPEVVP